ncbi:MULTISPECIES: hypothetical protein [Streptomyces violaceusniger group]|uniref:Uncharacterized protein n=2 Tax=Streptomyces rhizosphaericus TaxID=114699 RepID=A0ABP4C807_9ACTN|nr:MULTISPECIES: hypothetical protein [Streptomyces violaceusniger group]
MGDLASLRAKHLLKPVGTKGQIAIISNDGIPSREDLHVRPDRPRLRDRGARGAAAGRGAGLPVRPPAVASVLVGARSAARTRDAAALYTHPIPAALWDELRAEGLLPTRVPGEFGNGV